MLCAEILAIKIQGNKNIGGINVTRIEHKLSQFADDTSLNLDGSEKSTSKLIPNSLKDVLPQDKFLC
jgi:hypothetical protein